MTTTAAAPVPATSAPASRALPYVLVVLAVGQTVSSWISGEFAPEPLTSGVAESPLIPPGPWFAIWGLIITLSIAWSIVAIRPSVRDDAVRRRMAAGLVVTTAGWQLGVLALAGGVAVGLVVLSRGSFAYGLTASYALVGIAISTATQGFPVIGVAAVVAVVLVLVATAGMAFRRVRRAPARPGPAR